MSPTNTDGRAADQSTGAAHQRSRERRQLYLPARENTVLARTSTTSVVNGPVGPTGPIGSLNLDLPAPRAALDAVSAGNALLDAIGLLGSGAGELPCRVEDCDLWFAEVPAELERAKDLCAACPIRQLCLEAALARREPWGVWGGALFDHGVVIAQKRPRGRPRKEVAAEVAA